MRNVVTRATTRDSYLCVPDAQIYGLLVGWVGLFVVLLDMQLITSLPAAQNAHARACKECFDLYVVLIDPNIC